MACLNGGRLVVMPYDGWIGTLRETTLITGDSIPTQNLAYSWATVALEMQKRYKIRSNWTVSRKNYVALTWRQFRPKSQTVLAIEAKYQILVTVLYGWLCYRNRRNLLILLDYRLVVQIGRPKNRVWNLKTNMKFQSIQMHVFLYSQLDMVDWYSVHES